MEDAVERVSNKVTVVSMSYRILQITSLLHLQPKLLVCCCNIDTRYEQSLWFYLLLKHILEIDWAIEYLWSFNSVTTIIMLIKIMSQNEAKLDRISVTLSIDDLIMLIAISIGNFYQIKLMSSTFFKVNADYEV